VAPPSGGEVDTTAPELLQVNPAPGSPYFKGGDVQLVFSEYIEEKSVEKAIQIAPRLGIPLDLKYKGKEIWLNFPTELKSDQTYVISISRNLKDEHGVNLDESIQIAYSSGDYIDMGSISGKVLGLGDYALHLWIAAEDDSLLWKPPQYVIETGENGNFNFKYLSPGDYVMLALERSAGGLALIPERMNYGIPSHKIYHLEQDQSIENIFIRTRKEAPALALSRAEWLGQNWGWLYFNQTIYNLQINSLEIITENGALIQPDYFHDSQDLSRLLMFSSDTLTPGRISIRLEAETLEDSLFIRDSLEARVPALLDTSALELLKPASLIEISPDQDGGPNLLLIFSKPVFSTDQKALILTQGAEDTVEVEINWTNPMQMELLPVLDWKPNNRYSLKINTGNFIPYEGKAMQDSLIYIKINTGNQIGYGGLLGKVDSSRHTTLSVELKSVNNPQQEFIEVLNSDLQFRFNHIPEDIYKLILFEDLNKDGKYSFGKAYPYEPGEWFFQYPDSIKIRANWDLELLPFHINSGGK